MNERELSKVVELDNFKKLQQEIPAGWILSVDPFVNKDGEPFGYALNFRKEGYQTLTTHGHSIVSHLIEVGDLINVVLVIKDPLTRTLKMIESGKPLTVYQRAVFTFSFPDLQKVMSHLTEGDVTITTEESDDGYDVTFANGNLPEHKATGLKTVSEVCLHALRFLLGFEVKDDFSESVAAFFAIVLRGCAAKEMQPTFLHYERKDGGVFMRYGSTEYFYMK